MSHCGTLDVTVDLDGAKISHRLPGPFRVETFKCGDSVVVNANGINWVRFHEQPGAVMCRTAARAEEICAALNAAI